MDSVNPRSVTCPHCQAKPGSPCKSPSEHRLFGGKSHSERVTLAESTVFDQPPPMGMAHTMPDQLEAHALRAELEHAGVEVAAGETLANLRGGARTLRAMTPQARDLLGRPFTTAATGSQRRMFPEHTSTMPPATIDPVPSVPTRTPRPPTARELAQDARIAARFDQAATPCMFA